jgi:hypothetical protein
MPNPNTTPRTATPFAKPILAAFLLTTSFYMLHGVTAQACQLFHSYAWVALEILRPAISLTCRFITAHIGPSSGPAHHVLQVVAANWSVASWLAS